MLEHATARLLGFAVFHPLNQVSLKLQGGVAALRRKGLHSRPLHQRWPATAPSGSQPAYKCIADLLLISYTFIYCFQTWSKVKSSDVPRTATVGSSNKRKGRPWAAERFAIVCGKARWNGALCIAVPFLFIVSVFLMGNQEFNLPAVCKGSSY